jgi:hypothetical protein
MMYVLIAIIIVVIVLLMFIASQSRVADEDYLYGFWVADDDEFCAESEIDSMMLFIGEPDKGWFSNDRQCYIVIMNDLCSQSMTINYSPPWPGIGGCEYTISANVKFDEEDIWPESVKMTVNMQSGTLKVYSGDTIYAKLTKQHETTNVARRLSDSKLIDIIEN